MERLLSRPSFVPFHTGIPEFWELGKVLHSGGLGGFGHGLAIG